VVLFLYVEKRCRVPTVAKKMSNEHVGKFETNPPKTGACTRYNNGKMRLCQRAQCVMNVRRVVCVFV